MNSWARTLQIDPSRFFRAILFLGLISFFGYYSYHELSEIHASLGELKAKVALLEIDQKKTRRHQIYKESAPNANGLKEKLFEQLYLINGTTKEGAKEGRDEKKIKYLEGELLVQDLHVVDQDAFYDLLGVLLDDDAIKRIELPPGSRKIKRELLRFGVFDDLISVSADGQFRIKFDK